MFVRAHNNSTVYLEGNAVRSA